MRCLWSQLPGPSVSPGLPLLFVFFLLGTVVLVFWLMRRGELNAYRRETVLWLEKHYRGPVVIMSFEWSGSMKGGPFYVRFQEPTTGRTVRAVFAVTNPAGFSLVSQQYE